MDAGWLSQVIARLEACPGLLRRLPVLANCTCFVRDGRLVTPCQRPNHDSQRAPAEISVRHTPAVRAVMATASSPVITGNLAGQLAAACPGTPTESIDALLVELLARGFLLTSLHPPMTVTDALGHVIEELLAVNAENIAAVAYTVRTPRGPIDPGAAQRSPAGGPQGPTRVGHRSDDGAVRHRGAAPGSRPAARLLADPAAGGGTRGGKAMDALARLTPHPSGSPAWQDYHARFLIEPGAGVAQSVQRQQAPDLTGSGSGGGQFPQLQRL